MPTFFYSENDHTTASFYTDIINSTFFQWENSFLDKYSQQQLQNYSMIIYCQQFCKEIIERIFKQNIDKLGDVKQALKQKLQQNQSQNTNGIKQMDQQRLAKIINILGTCIFNRLQEIKQKYLLDSISMGSLYLKDINWKIIKTISSNSRSFYGQKYPYLFSLTLYLANTKSSPSPAQQNTKIVSFQVNKVQLKQFLTKLKSVKSEMI